MRRRGALLGGLALLLVVGVGCPKGEKETPDASGASSAVTIDPGAPLRVGEVALRYVPVETGIDAPAADKVDKRARDTLLGQPEFVPEDKPGQGPFSLRGSYRLGKKDPRDGSGQVVGTVYVSLVFAQQRAAGRLKESYVSEAFVGEALPAKGTEQEELSALLLSVLEESVLNIVKQVRVDRSADADLGKLLADEGDPEQLGFAIDAVRQRKLRTYAPRLVQLLGHSERDVVNRAASALGDVGDEKAIGPLIDAGSRVEPVDRLPVLYALGEIGGPQARLYLEALVEANTDFRVKAAAEQALERARRGDETPR